MSDGFNIRPPSPTIAKINSKVVKLIVLSISAILIIFLVFGSMKQEKKEENTDDVIVFDGKLEDFNFKKDKKAPEKDSRYDELITEINALKKQLAKEKEPPKESLKKAGVSAFRGKSAFQGRELPPTSFKNKNDKKIDEGFSSPVFFTPASFSGITGVNIAEKTQQLIKSNEQEKIDALLAKKNKLMEGIQGSGSVSPDISDLSSLIGGGSTVSDYFASNDQKGKQSFIKRQPDGKTYVNDLLHSPVSKFEIKAGTIIPVSLVTGLNSDLPGDIVAVVRENVYDTESGNFLLLPQMSKIIGEYHSTISYGQERILVVFNRIILPNGKSILLGNMPGVDLSGYAGISDEVDNHWFRIVSSVVLASVLNSLSGEVSSSDLSPYAAKAGESVSETASKIIEKQINIQPTITVRPGWNFNIFVKKDMVLEPYRES